MFSSIDLRFGGSFWHDSNATLCWLHLTLTSHNQVWPKELYQVCILIIYTLPHIFATNLSLYTHISGFFASFFTCHYKSWKLFFGYLPLSNFFISDFGSYFTRWNKHLRKAEKHQPKRFDNIYIYVCVCVGEDFSLNNFWNNYQFWDICILMKMIFLENARKRISNYYR